MPPKRKKRNAVRNLSSRGLSRALAPRGQGLAMGAVQTAPAAVAAMLPTRRFNVNSLRNGRMGDKLVSGCLPMLTVCAHTSEGFGLVDTKGTYHGKVLLSPVVPDLLCPLLRNEAMNYTRYRFKRLRFTYYAIGSTASGVRLNFAFVNDPMQYEFKGITGSSSYNLLSSTPNSIPFSPWSPWSMDCKVSTDLCYISQYTDITGSANTRQAYAGMIACLADSDPGVTFTYGQLWWDFDVELLDVCPTTSGLPTSAQLTSSSAGEEKGSTASIAVGTALPNPNVGPTEVIVLSSGASSGAVVRADPDYVSVEGPRTTFSASTKSAAASVLSARK